MTWSLPIGSGLRIGWMFESYRMRRSMLKNNRRSFDSSFGLAQDDKFWGVTKREAAISVVEIAAWF